MNTDQCIEMMKALQNAYQQLSQSDNIPSREVYRLSHVITEIELSIISIKKNIEIMKKKLIKRKAIKENKEIKPVELAPGTADTS